MESLGLCILQGSGLGIRQSGVEHLRLFTARENPLSWKSSNLQEGKDIPNPELLQDCEHQNPWGSSAGHSGQAQEPPAACIPAGERQEKKGCILNLSQRDKILWFLKPYSTGQQGREIRKWCSKGESGPSPVSAHTESYYQHQAEKSCSSYIDWPLS